LEQGASPRGRRALAEATGISEALLLRWINQADLFRIEGIGEEYADLLERAGVDTVPELAQRNPENLYAKLLEVNQEKNLVNRLPGLAQVADWVAEAKRLPRVVLYEDAPAAEPPSANGGQSGPASEQPWFKSYDKGVPQTLAPYPVYPLHAFLENAARKYPDSTAVLFKGHRVTYEELNALSNRLAAALSALGVKKGDRVIIFMPNSAQFVISYYAILKVGGVVVATNPLYSAREMEHQFNDAGAEIALVMSNFYNRVKEVQAKTPLKRIVVTNIKEYLPGLLRVLFTLAKEKKDGHRVELKDGDLWFKDLLAQYSSRQRPKVDVGPEDLALFQYSGGTTGLSKAAVIPHRALVANTLQIQSWLTDVQEGKEIFLAAIPLFHVYGMVAVMSFAISIGGALVMVPNPRDIPDLLENIDKYHPTIFMGVPTLYNAINNHPEVKEGKVSLKSIRACISGSAPLLLETKKRFETLTGGKLAEGYGLSEAPTATHCNPMYGVNKEGSIGLPFPDVEAKIISLEDGVTEMGVGEIGELVIRSPQLMRGYWQMPTETTNTLRDGWLYTGDIARMDEEGYFFIVDRKKELIKCGGFQVWPREIEEVLVTHPKVQEVGVAGIPDPYRGETVKAWVVLKPGETATPDEIRQWCQGEMAKYKVPTDVEFRQELPKTMVGKVLRRVLVEEEKQRAKADSAAPTAG
jgi:long-chain acyl-CoA synthetase